MYWLLQDVSFLNNRFVTNNSGCLWFPPLILQYTCYHWQFNCNIDPTLVWIQQNINEARWNNIIDTWTTPVQKQTAILYMEIHWCRHQPNRTRSNWWQHILTNLVSSIFMVSQMYLYYLRPIFSERVSSSIQNNRNSQPAS